jgi:hypothetical protein
MGPSLVGFAIGVGGGDLAASTFVAVTCGVAVAGRASGNDPADVRVARVTRPGLYDDLDHRRPRVGDQSLV